jgi:hypothetical protein
MPLLKLYQHIHITVRPEIVSKNRASFRMWWRLQKTAIFPLSMGIRAAISPTSIQQPIIKDYQKE